MQGPGKIGADPTLRPDQPEVLGPRDRGAQLLDRPLQVPSEQFEATDVRLWYEAEGSRGREGDQQAADGLQQRAQPFPRLPVAERYRCLVRSEERRVGKEC